MISPRVSAIPFTWKSGGKSSKGRLSFFETFLGLRSSSFRRKPVHLASTRGGETMPPLSSFRAQFETLRNSFDRPAESGHVLFLSLSLSSIPFDEGNTGELCQSCQQGYPQSSAVVVQRRLLELPIDGENPRQFLDRTIVSLFSGTRI